MKPSFYNFYKKDNGLVLIYNSASGNCIVIKETELSFFMTASLSDPDIQKMVELGFLVDDNVNEMDKLIHNAYSNLNNSKKDKYRILTTTACNAKCPYCYESGVKPVTMTYETADKVIEFILDKSKNQKIIEIEWFGGEPLVNKEIISYISEKILKLKPETLKYEASIITNGYLLNEEIISIMVNNWFVKRIQITLDGTANIYEKIKGLGKNSFQKVIDNISLLCNFNLEIDIRLNFDENNIENMKSLIEYISTLPFKDKLYVYPAKINNELRSENFALENETITMYNTLHKYNLIRGKKLLPKTMKNPCAASKKSYFTIHATGDLFKCDRKLLDNNSVGSVYDFFIKPLSDTSEWENINPELKCKSCKMFPLCWGGCIYEKIKKLDRCYITENIIYNNLGLILSELVERNIS